MSRRPPPLTLYVHLPWCVRKCPYCDFNSHAGQADEVAYVDALARDLRFELTQRQTWPTVQAIFFGGGTPSLFSAAAIGRILDEIRQQLRLSASIEITLEANPGTADAANFRGYREAGVNRLSLGVQSFNDQMLKSLGRIHDGDAASEAFHLARAAGFDNINIDLMHGLPGQDTSMALADLDQALALKPEHLSWYQLTIEPGTAFGQNPPRLPEDDTLADIEDAGLKRLRRAGLSRYEVSAYARPGHRSRHNLNYWRFGDYLGIGAGAHGKLTQPGGIWRRARLRSPQRFMASAGSAAVLADCRQPSPAELISEFALNTLRIRGAFTQQRFEDRTGLDIDRINPALREAQALGLACWRNQAMHVTPLGRRHLNRLLECFAETAGLH